MCLTLADAANEILRIITGSLLIISILLPNLIASTRERLRFIATAKGDGKARRCLHYQMTSSRENGHRPVKYKWICHPTIPPLP